MIKGLVKFLESAQSDLRQNVVSLGKYHMDVYGASDEIRDLKNKKRYNGASIMGVRAIGVADLSFKQMKQIKPDFECTCGILNMEHEKRAPRMIVCDEWAVDYDDYGDEMSYVGDGPTTYSHLPNGFGYDRINDPDYDECSLDGECDGCLETNQAYNTLNESDLFSELDDMSFSDENFVGKTGVLGHYTYGELGVRTLCKCADNPNYLPLSERVNRLTELGYDPMKMFVVSLEDHFMNTADPRIHREYTEAVGVEWEKDLAPYGYQSLYLVDYMRYFKVLTNKWVSPNHNFTRTLNYVPQSPNELKGSLANKLVEMGDVLIDRSRGEHLRQHGSVFKILGFTKGWNRTEILHLMNVNNPSFIINVSAFENDDGKIVSYDNEAVIHILPDKRKVVNL